MGIECYEIPAHAGLCGWNLVIANIHLMLIPLPFTSAFSFQITTGWLLIQLHSPTIHRASSVVNHEALSTIFFLLLGWEKSEEKF